MIKLQWFGSGTKKPDGVKTEKAAANSKKAKAMIPVFILSVIPVIILLLMLNYFSARVHGDTEAQVKSALSGYAGVLDGSYSVNYEYYRSATKETAPIYVAMTRILFHCKDGVTAQSPELTNIRNSFIRGDESGVSYMGDTVIQISPVTFVYKDGTSETFCQNVFPLSDGGQSGGIIDAEHYVPTAPPLVGVWLIMTSWIVCWTIAYGYYRMKVKKTNDLADLTQEHRTHKVTFVPDVP